MSRKGNAGRCVFCNRTRLTKEHIWSDWLKSVVPNLSKSSGHTQFVIHEHWDVRQKKLVIQPFTPEHRHGHLQQRKLRNVCKRCNTGWMSEIVDHAKPFAGPLILDKAAHLNTNAQIALAAWITLACIMAEFTDTKSAGIPSVDREALWKTKKPLNNWTICLGRYSGTDWSNMRYRHHGKMFSLDSNQMGVVGSTPNYLQVSTYTLGGLLIHAFSSTENTVVDHFRRSWIPSGTIRIWPVLSDLIDWPRTPILTDGSVTAIADTFSATFG